MFLRALSTSLLFLCMTTPDGPFLASVVSFLLDLVLDSVTYVALPERQSVVDYPFSCFGGVEPDLSEANLPKGLSSLLSHAMSSIR